MKAINPYYSAEEHGRRMPPQRQHAMPPTDVVDAVKTAQAMSLENWWNLVLAFLLGGFTSAVWTWREAKRQPEWREIVSTFIVTGLVAVLFAAYLMEKIDTRMVVVISILCGFSGDSLIRIVVRGFKAVVSRVAGTQEDPR